MWAETIKMSPPHLWCNGNTPQFDDVEHRGVCGLESLQVRRQLSFFCSAGAGQ